MVVSRRVSGRFSALVLVLGLVGCAEERRIWPTPWRPGPDCRTSYSRSTKRSLSGVSTTGSQLFWRCMYTGYSFDAYAFGTIATPYDAYRYARGEAIDHPAGYQVSCASPWIFMRSRSRHVHGTAEGGGQHRTDFSAPRLPSPCITSALQTTTEPSASSSAPGFCHLPARGARGSGGWHAGPEAAGARPRSAWADSINAADQFYQPGEFTTFAAYEYTSSTDEMGNLHRNVVFRGTERLPAVPFPVFIPRIPRACGTGWTVCGSRASKACPSTTPTVPTGRCLPWRTGPATPWMTAMPTSECAMSNW